LPVLFILALPILGSYPSEILDNVGIYVLMGLGLNIVVGFAGLLDLGYVAFFAIGAYTMGVLTSPEMTWHPLQLGFWGALPIAVLMATLWGVILGIPVLGMRGDYLAIVTLGFGEIIRLLALSDALKPFIGGSNGITGIPKPSLGPIALDTPQTLYYLILAACLLAVFVSTRVKDSRLGRAWMALREDEDVAEAMGIDLVRTKLMAFATGAAFAGLAGAIFASKLTSVYPHSMQLLISINVLCVVIVGGIGSIPGVVVGAIFLIGLPEILREFAEYRLLLYGAALVIMMLTRPEGLVPEARHALELHETEAGAGE
jgi:branched-chain amino acid transport system permease protein